MKTSQKSSVAYMETTEQRRLNETREKGIPWKKWGPYLSETTMGHCPRRLQPGRECLELFQPRAIALSRLSMGRRWAGWSV